MLDALKKAPYYDDYYTPDETGKTHEDKSYTQLLAVPGRVAQAREITQIQTVMKDIIKNIGDSIMKDGNIIEGCQVIPFVDVDSKKKVRVTPGKVYIQGMVLSASETVLDDTNGFTGVGPETIGVRLVEEIVTHDGANGDPTLRDPAQSYANYNQPGCDRLKSYVEIVANQSDAATIATLLDGEITVERYAHDYDTITQTLARRTYDESGSYIVDGLKVRIESASDDRDFNVVVEPGKAYVLGYELKRPSAHRITIPRSTEYISIGEYNYNYTSGRRSYELSPYPYVKEITFVRGRTQTTENDLTISSATGRSALEAPATSEIEIVSVTQGSKVYTEGIDYELQRDGAAYIKWTGGGEHPDLDRQYSVTYTYLREYYNNVDYRLDNGTHLYWIDIENDEHHPIEGGEFLVSFDNYLARQDIVCIDPYGEISVILGTPDLYQYVTSPEVPVNTLKLADIMSPPNGEVTNASTRISVSNVGLTRFTMSDIQKLLKRIRTMEYDQAVLSLDNDARQRETSKSEKRGLFTDPLVDLYQVDYYYNSSASSDLPTYKAVIDMNYNTCYLPVKSEIIDLNYDPLNSTAQRLARSATLKKIGENPVLEQMSATRSFLVNPYSVFPQLPELFLNPDMDSWVDTSYVTVPVSKELVEYIDVQGENIDVTGSMVSGAVATTETTTRVHITPAGTNVLGSEITSESVILEEAATSIRARDVEIEGSQFPRYGGGLDNIKCTFDGIPVDLTPIEPTVAGTEKGSVRAGEDGKLRARFRIPDNVPTGIKEVRLFTTIPGYENEGSAFALYTATGIRRVVEQTVTTTTQRLFNRVTDTITTTTFVDPVGQTFVLDRMTMVSGIDLYFEAKPEGTTPVTCEIRDVVNGSIGSTVYGHKTLSANPLYEGDEEYVRTSSDGRVSTRFQFNDPVLLEANKEYAFVVRSASPSYRLWVAELGQNDISTGKPVLSNPYLIGVMMSSSNNSSWTMHQTMDIKFRLLEDIYENSSEVVFDEIVGSENFSRIYMAAESIIPNGTSVKWSYSLDSGNTYKPMTPNNLILLGSMGTSVKIKASLSNTSNPNISPIIALNSVATALSSHRREGCYITKNFSGLDAFTDVDIIVDSVIPDGTELEVFVVAKNREDDTDVLTKCELQPNSKDLSYGWYEQTYRVTGLTGDPTMCRVFIKMKSDTDYRTPSFRRLRAIMS